MRLVERIPVTIVGGRDHAEVVVAVEDDEGVKAIRRPLRLSELVLLQYQIGRIVCDQVQAEIMRQTAEKSQKSHPCDLQVVDGARPDDNS